MALERKGQLKDQGGFSQYKSDTLSAPHQEQEQSLTISHKKTARLLP